MQQLSELMELSQDLTVLYVEDCPSLRREMAEVLEELFNVVLLAKDGKEGLEVFDDHKVKEGLYPDIVITDINMPKVSGLEMSQQILTQHPEQLIVVLSAHDESSYLRDFINMGIDSYLIKPVESLPFLQTLQRASKKIKYKQLALSHTEELEKLAYMDAMTGIANRRKFFKEANALFDMRLLPDASMHVCIIDIDKFKTINDTYGHDMGDEVIRTFVEIVKQEMGEKDCFARFGGDEFVLMLQMHEEEALTLIEKIHKNIGKRHTILDKKIYFSVSMGFTQLYVYDQNIDTVLKRADINLYEVKNMKKYSIADFAI